MIFTLLMLAAVARLHYRYLKHEVRPRRLATGYIIIALAVSIAGFLSWEIAVLAAAAAVLLLLRKAGLLGPGRISGLAAALLCAAALYCQTANGLLSTEVGQFYRIYHRAAARHLLFPFRIITKERRIVIRSLGWGLRLKERPFQETVWFDDGELIYEHDVRGFGAIDIIPFNYRTGRPHDYP